MGGGMNRDIVFVKLECFQPIFVFVLLGIVPHPHTHGPHPEAC